MGRRGLGFLLFALAAVPLVAAGTFGSGDDHASHRPTWIESRAACAFSGTASELRGASAAYRVDAHVFLPLGFTSIELWHRAGVGKADVSYHDYRDEEGRTIRAFELFAVSDPARAQGFDRRGFFREALRLSPPDVEWTAYFGAMTSWPEKTLEEARRSAGGPQPHTYEAIDGLSSPLETRSSVYQVSTEARMTDAASLWAAIRPQLDQKPPQYVKSQTATPSQPLPAVAFLGALQSSLRSAAAHRLQPLPPAATRVAFTYNGVTRQIELESMSPDLKRGRKAVAGGLARNAADLVQMRYRIISPGGSAEFVLWAELPAGLPDNVMAPPIIPLGWEMQLRSYLRLSFERTR
jgi:hypothetical protein